MSRGILAAFLSCCALLAQTVTIANPAPVEQLRWVVAAVPPVAGETLEPRTLGGMLALPGPRVGAASQLWFVRAKLGAGEVRTASDWTPAALPADWRPQWPAFDRPLQTLVPRLAVTVGAGPRLEAPCDRVSIESDAARVVARLELHAGGWHLLVWQTAWVDQLTVDVAGCVVWCDPTTPALFLEQATIEVSWPDGGGQLFGAARQGLSLQDGRWRLWSGRVPNAMAFPFRGALLGREAPLLACAAWPDGSWMGFGSRPAVPPLTRGWFDGFLAGAGSLVDWRPGASNLETGSTGDQACFGAQAGLGAAGGDPWALRELLWSADDGLLRGGHHLELDGRPVTRESHPRWQTFGLASERNSGDRLGKGPEVWGWDKVGQRSVLIDDQHRGTGPEEAALALTGDPMLAWDCRVRLEADRARAKLLRGQLDAPRASGRWWQSLARLAMVSDAPTREVIRQLALAELDLRVQQWGQTAPVRPLLVLTDDRVLPGLPSWVPWNEAQGDLGAFEQARAWDRLGEAATAARFLAFAQELARTISDFGVLRSEGAWLACTGVQWFDGGAAPPAGYYDYPRAGAGTTSVPGNNLLVGGGGWLDWMAPAFVAAAAGGDAQALELVRDLRPTAGAPLQALRWWACR